MKRIIDAVIIALENMQPERPIKKRYVDYEGLKNILIGKCPSCKWNVACYDRYCSNCGQRLDWDTTKTNRPENKLYWE